MEQEGDANGVVRGSYAYIDPNHEWQKVTLYILNTRGEEKQGLNGHSHKSPQNRIVSFPLIHRSYERALLVIPNRRLLFVIR